jgi:hypothetical protein
MTQPFADALTWVPKSRALGATLSRAHDLARAQNHAAVTLEHLLLALVEDPDASSVLLSCNIDLLKLNASIAEYVQQQPAGSGEMPEAAPALRTILEYAVAAARQSRRNEINGAIVLAAVIGEGKSEAAKLLLAAGLKFQDTVAALKRSNAAQRPAPAEPPPTLSASVVDARPATEPVTEPEIQRPAPAIVESATEAGPPVAHSFPRPGGAHPPGLATIPAQPANGGQYSFDEDPVTTARRRIAAIRSGQTPPSPSSGGGSHGSINPRMSEGNAAVALSPDQFGAQQRAPQIAPTPAAAGSDWAPTPLPQAGTPGARPVRMPPPVPPVADAPVRRIGLAPGIAPASSAPWSDGAPADAVEVTSQTASVQPSRPPIEPADLIDAIPVKIPHLAATTIEIRIPRSAVFATSAASNGLSAQGRGQILTRAVAIRLRAPAGGFSVENASPETQWFDSRSAQREDEEVRWRWVVTPRSRGRLPLQLSITMRTLAADGMIVDTTLPEQQATVRVSGNARAVARTMATWSLAALIGGVLTLLASVGLAGLLGRVFQ